MPRSELPDADRVAAELDGAEPREIVQWAVRLFAPDVVVSFSGAEDVVLIDMAQRVGAPFRTITLDTGRLHPETYRFLERVREHYGITVEAFFPDPGAVQALTREKGFFSFFRDGHQECCSIRKVEPLRRALAGARAYITGQRQDQSPDTRGLLPIVQEDANQRAPDGSLLLKFNPLSHWTAGDVWQYIRQHGVPYNELHDRGFRSIGCEPCTMATNPGQHEREGRWWWEEATRRECGIHLPAVTETERTP